MNEAVKVRKKMPLGSFRRAVFEKESERMARLARAAEQGKISEQEREWIIATLDKLLKAKKEILERYSEKGGAVSDMKDAKRLAAIMRTIEKLTEIYRSGGAKKAAQ